MIYVPLWLFILTLAAKCLTIVKGAWQVRCTRIVGHPVLPMSVLCMGMASALTGLLYYSWMAEPIGIMGHIYTITLTGINMYYKRIECTTK